MIRRFSYEVGIREEVCGEKKACGELAGSPQAEEDCLGQTRLGCPYAIDQQYIFGQIKGIILF